jgi:hypothetical protein
MFPNRILQGRSNARAHHGCGLAAGCTTVTSRPLARRATCPPPPHTQKQTQLLTFSRTTRPVSAVQVKKPLHPTDGRARRNGHAQGRLYCIAIGNIWGPVLNFANDHRCRSQATAIPFCSQFTERLRVARTLQAGLGHARCRMGRLARLLLLPALAWRLRETSVCGVRLLACVRFLAGRMPANTSPAHPHLNAQGRATAATQARRSGAPPLQRTPPCTGVKRQR